MFFTGLLTGTRIVFPPPSPHCAQLENEVKLKKIHLVEFLRMKDFIYTECLSSPPQGTE